MSSKFTIVVPTHNRQFRVTSLLRSISATAPESLAKIVVVDDSDRSTDLPDRTNLNVEHIRISARVFISRAKNLGWNMASTEFVYFIDDDNIVCNETFTPVLREMMHGPKIGALVPAVLYKRSPNLVWVYSTPLSKDRWKHDLIGRNEPRNKQFEGKLIRTDALPNACLLRRKALEEVGGFNEALAVNSSAELAIRLQKAGWSTYSCTNAFIYHDVEPPGRLGWWATHGIADPERVYYEVKDWFALMRFIHSEERFFKFRAAIHSARFILPNSLAYLVRGGPRRWKLLARLANGLTEALVEEKHNRTLL